MSAIEEALQKGQATEDLRVLVNGILELNPLHRRFLESALNNLTATELANLGNYLAYCRTSGLDMEYLADSYMTIVEDTFTEQIFFQRNGHYRNSSFEEVSKAVYFNDDYMNRYMYGLAISSFLWPNHVALSRFYQETFPRDKTGNYLEIGPGHGYYTLTALNIGSMNHIKAVDISATSLAQTRAVLEHFHPGSSSQVTLQESDFLDAGGLPAASFDILVMGEVLEHVEQPQLFLERLRALAAPNAHIFITTCINAPAIDHIYLWRTLDDLEDMIRASGLNIQQHLYLPYEGKTLDEALEAKLAINVAYVLSAP